MIVLYNLYNILGVELMGFDNLLAVREKEEVGNDSKFLAGCWYHSLP